MTVVTPVPGTRAAPVPHPAQRSRPARDAGIDLVRSACLIGVVLVHALMAGVSLDASGAPVIENAAEGRAWFVPLSWLIQIMPLFFLVGGFAARRGHRAARARGVSPGSFAAARVRRLLAPCLAAIAIPALGLAALTGADVPDALVAEAGFRLSQPLWFLGVYLLCQTLVPAMIGLHERAPRRTLAALAAGAVAIDVAARVSGIPAIGFANLALVWLLMQQLGFRLADRGDRRVPPLRRVAGGLAPLLVLGGAVAAGFYSPDMFVNLNPPTFALVLLGLAQLQLLAALRPTLERLARGRRAGAVSAWINGRPMTIYLWHMPVLLALAGLGILLAQRGAAVLPAVGDATWWLTRPLWFVLALAATAVVVRSAGRVELHRAPVGDVSWPRAALAALLGVLAVLALLAGAFTVATALTALVLLAAALALLGARPAAVVPPRAPNVRAGASATSGGRPHA